MHNVNIWVSHYTYFSLENPTKVIAKQCRPRSDVLEHGVRLGYLLFANIKPFSTRDI